MRCEKRDSRVTFMRLMYSSLSLVAHWSPSRGPAFVRSRGIDANVFFVASSTISAWAPNCACALYNKGCRLALALRAPSSCCKFSIVFQRLKMSESGGKTNGAMPPGYISPDTAPKCTWSASNSAASPHPAVPPRSVSPPPAHNTP